MFAWFLSAEGELVIVFNESGLVYRIRKVFESGDPTTVLFRFEENGRIANGLTLMVENVRPSLDELSLFYDKFLINMDSYNDPANRSLGGRFAAEFGLVLSADGSGVRNAVKR